LLGISLRKIGANNAYPTGHSRELIEIQPGLVSFEYPIGETPQRAATFINKFMATKVSFSLVNFMQ